MQCVEITNFHRRHFKIYMYNCAFLHANKNLAFALLEKVFMYLSMHTHLMCMQTFGFTYIHIYCVYAHIGLYSALYTFCLYYDKHCYAWSLSSLENVCLPFACRIWTFEYSIHWEYGDLFEWIIKYPIWRSSKTLFWKWHSNIKYVFTIWKSYNFY